MTDKSIDLQIVAKGPSGNFFTFSTYSISREDARYFLEAFRDAAVKYGLPPPTATEIQQKQFQE